MTSRASELFSQIKDGGIEFLRAFVEKQTVETHYLEFKGGRIQTDDKGCKEAFSEAVSGFANTEGGILVFGIRASRTKDPDNPSIMIDTANAIESVDRPDAFQQRLRDRILEATIPPVSGVDFFALEDPGDAGKGFVVCYVPEGNDKPYRAALHSSKNYMQRVDDRFVVIQHSLLRTMFFPRLQSRLRVEIVPKVSSVESNIEIVFKGSIENCGVATARELWVVVRQNLRLRRQQMFSFKPREGMIQDGQAWEAFQSIHPGAKVPAFWYALEQDAAIPIPIATFSIQLYSQHQLAQDVEIHLTSEQILKGIPVAEDAIVRKE